VPCAIVGVLSNELRDGTRLRTEEHRELGGERRRNCCGACFGATW